MQPDDTPLEEALAREAPRTWSRAEVLGNLRGQSPTWVRYLRPHYAGDWDELVQYLGTLPEKQDNDRVRSHLGLVVLHLGQQQGLAIFLELLRHDDPARFTLALDQVRHLSHGPSALPDDWAQPLADGLAAALDRPMREHEAEAVMDYFTRKVPQAAHRHLVALQRRPDAVLGGRAIGYFAGLDRDVGTFDAIAGFLLEPGIRAAKDLMHRGSLAADLCLRLSVWTKPPCEERHRERAAALAAQVLRECMAAPNAAERLRSTCHGWIYPESLLAAVSFRKSAEAAALLQDVAAFRAIDAIVRAVAMAHLHAMTGLMLPERPTVIADLLASGGDSLGESLQQVADAGLVTLPELLLAAAQPTWCYRATTLLKAWPREANADAQIVAGLRTALAGYCGAGPVASHPRAAESIRYLVEVLAPLARTPADNADLGESLARALASARECAEKPWLAQGVMAHMTALGLGERLDLNAMRPWDAMDQHWLRTGTTWTEAAQLLAEAGAIDPAPLERTAAIPPGGFDSLCHLIDAQQSRLVFFSIRDNGYEHDHAGLFGQLVGALRPPLALEAVVQRGNVEFKPVPHEERPGFQKQIDGVPVYTTEGTLQQVHVYHAGQGFSFRAAPQGTWMDVWAVLHAFDRFMALVQRPERAHWLAPGDSGEWALFLCADPTRLRPVLQQLRMPLNEPTV